MCCFHQRACLGNLLDTPLADIWHGPVAEAIRKDTLEHKLHPTCAAATCPFIVEQGRLQNKVTTFGSFDWPVQLEIDLPTQHCNIGGEQPSEQNPACLMCERHTNFTPQVDRLDDVCVVLKPYVRHLRQIHIQGVAEPFWKDRIFDISRILDLPAYKHRFTITTTTNGTVLTTERMKKWLEFPYSCLVFSLDASTPETFKKIRRLNAYDKVVRSLMEFASLRGPGQYLKIHNNINTLNVGEVVGMVELAAKAGVDFLEFNPTYCTPDIEVTTANVHLFDKAQREINEAAARLGVRTNFLRTLTLNLVQLKI